MKKATIKNTSKEIDTRLYVFAKYLQIAVVILPPQAPKMIIND